MTSNESVHNDKGGCVISEQANNVHTYLIEYDPLLIPREKMEV